MVWMISVADFFKIVGESSTVEQAFDKYMHLLDPELWDFSALSAIFDERRHR